MEGATFSSGFTLKAFQLSVKCVSTLTLRSDS